MTQTPGPDAAHAPSLAARIAIWSARHRRKIVLAWVAAIIVAVASYLPRAREHRHGADSRRANRARPSSYSRSASATCRFPTQEVVVFSSSKYKVTDPIYKDTVQALMAQLRDLRDTADDDRGRHDGFVEHARRFRHAHPL